MRQHLATRTVASCLIGLVLPVLGSATNTWGADDADPPLSVPELRTEPGGPISFVTSLAFSTNADVLYAGGWDKVVRVWLLDPAAPKFLADAPATYRVPISPGLGGVINAIALSPDGQWLAVGGQGTVRGASELRQPGWIVPQMSAMTPEMRRDQGTIWLFNTLTRAARPLRGHQGPVTAMTFAPAGEAKPPMLLSLAQEWDGESRGWVTGLRLWNAAEAKYVAGVGKLPFVETRPGIVAWHCGPKANQLRVGLALGDPNQSLRVWDLETNQLLSVQDGQFGSTIGRGPMANTIVTGSTGRLRLWQINAENDQPSGLKKSNELTLPNLAVPRAIVCFTDGAAQRGNRAAVVVRIPGAAPDYRLRLVDLERFQLLGQEVPLDFGRDAIPALSVDVLGRFLAVAGNLRQEIQVFSLLDLVPGHPAPQTIRGAGIEMHSAAFARNKENALGLVLSTKRIALGGAQRPPANGDLIFDPVRAQVSRKREGWRTVAPNLQGSTVQLGPRAAGRAATGQTLNIAGGPQGPRSIRLPLGQQVTAFAVLPSAALAAVATHELGQPQLRLYDLKTARPFRQLTGHVERIGSLAFSDDGKLLVSTGEDRTLCVWNLTDTAQVVGSRGMLEGLGVELREGRLKVTQTPSPAGDLAAGDTIQGLVDKGRLQPSESPVAFYLAVSRFRAGEKVVLRVSRAGQPEHDLPITLVQGVDERKPLFSLFVDRGDAAHDTWRWIGWSPLGPFESSGPDSDQLLGWHFNTGISEEPAKFAAADEYAKLRHQGLLRHLLHEQRLPEEKTTALKPTMTMWVEQTSPELVNAEDLTPLRLVRRQATLNLVVDEVPSEVVDHPQWRMDGAPDWQPLEPVSARQWRASLDDVDLGRGIHHIITRIGTKEPESRRFSQDLEIMYQPLRPKVEIESPGAKAGITQEPAFEFRACVGSRIEGEGVDIHVLHSANGKTIEEWDEKAPGSDPMVLTRSLKLQLGENTLTLKATNSRAPVEQQARDAETAITERTITVTPPHGAPPSIALEVIGPDKRTVRELVVEDAEPLQVDVSQLVVKGEIKAEQPIQQVGWSNDHDSPRPVEGFVSEKVARFCFQQSVSLKPGLQTIEFQAKTTDSISGKSSLRVEYRPRLPRIQDVRINPGRAETTGLVWNRDPAQVVFSGRLVPSAEPHPYRAELFLNDQSLGEVPLRENAFEVPVDLSPGESRIQLRLRNEWGAVTTTEVRRVWFKRPPHIVKMEVPPTWNRPLMNCVFWIESPAEFDPQELRINDRKLPLDAAKVESRTAELITWRVDARNVPMQAGINKLAPSARNEDGWSEDQIGQSVTVALAPPSRPKIVLLSPLTDGAVDRADLHVRFRVISDRPCHRVAVSVAGRETELALPAADGEQDLASVELKQQVTLQRGLNALQIVVQNEGGESLEQINVTYIPTPVKLAIKGLRLQSQDLSAAELELRGDGRIRFSPAAEGRCWLEGRAEFAPHFMPGNQPELLRVLVNGFLQAQVPLVPIDGEKTSRRWRASLRLNQKERNFIEVEIPGLVQDSANRKQFEVDCVSPDRRQRLHLMIIDADEQAPQNLIDDVQKAVQAERTDKGLVQSSTDKVRIQLVSHQSKWPISIKTPAFDEGYIYGPLIGSVDRARIEKQLARIRSEIEARSARDGGNDLAMIYYQGPEVFDQEGHFASLFQDCPGAQLFLIHVQRKASANLALGWTNRGRAAALRCAALTEEAPPEARLLDALAKAVSKAQRLEDVGAELSEIYAHFNEAHGPVLAFDRHIPVSLRSLMLGKP